MQIVNYAVHLVAAGLLIVAFFMLYTWLVPYDEITLIRQGNSAAALSLGGALIGFSITIASGIVHTDSLLQFAGWAAGAALVQVVTYMLVTRLLHMSKEHVESGNAAFGGLLGAIAIAVGAVNAACLS